ncbi:arginine repressor [Ligilactobacillus salitolerans]|uniref:Arginine repressor n=1 Tax=Ligilactobacillus salitolerans TaxID=1808352 RepID=A0A401IRC5_9LACO|nr:arginine repressor [Ligilactobacillus salitolerans]GBG94044.1 arginine repressor [Ligilactobacillus salitolerans]
MHREKRLDLIKKIVDSKKIATQEDLLAALKNEGVVATQATVSRDIKTLGLFKSVKADGTKCYVTPYEQKKEKKLNKIHEAIRSNVTGVERIAWLNIVRMPLNSNYANALGSLFDTSNMPEIVGTLAGNDTLVIISRSEDDAIKMKQFILESINK